MGRKRRTKSGANISPELHARIVELSDLIWGGNRSRMARDLGIDQAAISRVLAGRQQPGAKLLERLAAWEGVNAVWLFSGEGAPLGAVPAGGGRYRPISDHVLPGSPADHRGRLSGVSFPVPEAFYTPTSYYFRVPHGWGLSGRHGTLVGDLILMEADTKWTRQAQAVPGKFCGFLAQRGKRAQILLGRVAPVAESDPFEDPYEAYPVELFGDDVRGTFIVPGPQREIPQAHAGALHLGSEDVVCVSVLLVRPYGPRRDVMKRRGSGR